jgi:hypothetical protein
VLGAISKCINHSSYALGSLTAKRPEVFWAKDNHFTTTNRIAGCAKAKVRNVCIAWVDCFKKIWTKRRALVFEHRNIEVVWQFAEVFFCAWAQWALIRRRQVRASVAVSCNRHPVSG